MTNVPLKRNISLLLITFYGLGNILGAGIYVLVGKVAGEAGYLSPFSFFIASIIAAISAVAYAEMASRYPLSAGEAVYIYEGFGRSSLASLVGVLIACAGIISSAVISHGFAGYLQVYVDLPKWLIIVMMYMALGGLAIWGIKESVGAAAILTVIEVIGLVMVIYAGADEVVAEGFLYEEIFAEFKGDNITVFGVMSGAFLAFYAYIGFEDMVNISEEVRQPEKNMPKAIMLCVIISTLLYAAVALVAIAVIEPQQLAASGAPLTTVYEKASSSGPLLITLISLFAVVNGALIQLIMSSRILYGMANKDWLPGWLAVVHPKRQTPVNSTVTVVVVAAAMAVMFNLKELAELTSYLVLIVFSLVNLSLVRIKGREEVLPIGSVSFSIVFPLIGFICCVVIVAFQIVSLIL